LGNYRRKVDCILAYPDSVYLVEAAILPDPGKMGQLEYYLDLFPMTPEFADLVHLPRRGVLLVAQDEAPLRARAEWKDLLWVVYQPLWVGAYLVERIPRRNPTPA